MDSYRMHGKGNFKYENVRIGMNSRLDTIQASILQVKLKAFDVELVAVKKAAEEYTARLEDIVETPGVPPGIFTNRAQYTIKLNSKSERDGLKKYLEEQGIPSMVYYPVPMHRQEAYMRHNQYDSSFQVTEKLCDTVLSLPIHAYISLEEINEVSSAISNYLNYLNAKE